MKTDKDLAQMGERVKKDYFAWRHAMDAIEAIYTLDEAEKGRIKVNLFQVIMNIREEA